MHYSKLIRLRRGMPLVAEVSFGSPPRSLPLPFTQDAEEPSLRRDRLRFTLIENYGDAETKRADPVRWLVVVTKRRPASPAVAVPAAASGHSEHGTRSARGVVGGAIRIV